jgi:AcrR family transcriptional regulator
MSIETKEDRRVRKTKRALREGLSELLTEKSLQKITVRELTDKVDIHRSTFYANYNDIYDLYSRIEDSVIQEITDIFSETYTVDSEVFFEILFKYISENRQVCRMFLGKNVSPTFYSRLTDFLKEAYLICWRSEYGFTGTAEELEYYVHFYISGSLAVIGKWADGNFEYSTEKLMMMFIDINNNLDIHFP